MEQNAKMRPRIELLRLEDGNSWRRHTVNGLKGETLKTKKRRSLIENKRRSDGA